MVLSKDLNSLIEYPSGGILSKELIKTPVLNATLFCMAKATELSEHTSTSEGLVHVLEGKGEFTLKGKPLDMSPGVLIHLEREAPHSIRAEEDTAFLLILKVGR